MGVSFTSNSKSHWWVKKFVPKRLEVKAMLGKGYTVLTTLDAHLYHNPKEIDYSAEADSKESKMV